MAVITATPVTAASGYDMPTGVRVYKWTLAAGDTGAAVPCGNAPDKTVQYYDGSWSDSTLTIEGSNQADLAAASVTEWVTLSDPNGDAISKTADGIETVMENTFYIRPALSTGSATATGIVVYLLLYTNARR